jgi:hypothetical protein
MFLTKYYVNILFLSFTKKKNDEVKLSTNSYCCRLLGLPKVEVGELLKSISGLPIPGVNIQVKNASITRVTDMDGRFFEKCRPDRH